MTQEAVAPLFRVRPRGRAATFRVLIGGQETEIHRLALIYQLSHCKSCHPLLFRSLHNCSPHPQRKYVYLQTSEFISCPSHTLTTRKIDLSTESSY
jgi:hypothetical protein